MCLEVAQRCEEAAQTLIPQGGTELSIAVLCEWKNTARPDGISIRKNKTKKKKKTKNYMTLLRGSIVHLIFFIGFSPTMRKQLK